MNFESIAKQTLAIVEAGFYESGGQRVEIGAAARAATASTRLYTPDDLAALTSRLAPRGARAGKVSVTGESTTACAGRLAQANGRAAACLNFASGRRPGGGFLGGARAQEEAVCRVSSLYPTLLTQRGYYEENRAAPDTRYTDHTILSPEVVVFRDDRLQLLAEPFLATFVTAPAPNAGALPERLRSSLPEIFERRIRYVLAVAIDAGATELVLGAWGCGAFRNPPAMVASAFARVLDEGWASHFEEVVFAILDSKRSDKNLDVFSETLAR